MKGKPTNSIMEVIKMISDCSSIEEVEGVKHLVVEQLYRYSVADQGFLLTMVGIQIMKLEDASRSFDRFFREIILGSIVVSTDN